MHYFCFPVILQIILYLEALKSITHLLIARTIHFSLSDIVLLSNLLKKKTKTKNILENGWWIIKDPLQSDGECKQKMWFVIEGLLFVIEGLLFVIEGLLFVIEGLLQGNLIWD